MDGNAAVVGGKRAATGANDPGAAGATPEKARARLDTAPSPGAAANRPCAPAAQFTRGARDRSSAAHRKRALFTHSLSIVISFISQNVPCDSPRRCRFSAQGRGGAHGHGGGATKPTDVKGLGQPMQITRDRSVRQHNAWLDQCRAGCRRHSPAAHCGAELTCRARQTRRRAWKTPSRRSAGRAARGPG